MTLTKKGEYALRTMIQLGLAKCLGKGLVPVSELAQSNRLPLKFIERILLELREAGYVETQRGKLGGYLLAKPMEQIRMGELVRLIDGRLAPIACASETEYSRCTCPDEEHCGLRMLMIDVRNAISNILDKYTLGEVVDVALRKMKRDNTPLPFTPEPAQHLPTGRRIADPAQGFLSQLGIQSAFEEPSPNRAP
ncbi:MAG: Rrf2 family transcriptional regulator [Verrucomicrobiota bacterium]